MTIISRTNEQEQLHGKSKTTKGCTTVLKKNDPTHPHSLKSGQIDEREGGRGGRERERERCRLYLLVYCPWLSLLLLLCCPSLSFFLFCTARRALVYTRDSRLINISLLLSLLRRRSEPSENRQGWGGGRQKEEREQQSVGINSKRRRRRN